MYIYRYIYTYVYTYLCMYPCMLTYIYVKLRRTHAVSCCLSRFGGIDPSNIPTFFSLFANIGFIEN